MSSNINWKSPQAIALYVAGGLLVGFMAKEAFSPKPAPETVSAPEPLRDVTEELTGPSETGTVNLNVGSDDDPGWKIYDPKKNVYGGKKSRRKQRKNKSKKSRPKSKRMTKNKK